MRHMREYVAQVNADPIAGMQKYLDQYVYAPTSWTHFLEMIGVGELLAAARAGRALYDA